MPDDGELPDERPRGVARIVEIVAAAVPIERPKNPNSSARKRRKAAADAGFEGIHGGAGFAGGRYG